MWLDQKFTHREESSPNDIGAGILSPTEIDKPDYTQNCIIRSSSRIWKQIKSKFEIKSLSFLLPVGRRTSFTPSAMHFGYLTYWRPEHRNDIFRYLQIRDYVRKCSARILILLGLMKSWGLDEGSVT